MHYLLFLILFNITLGGAEQNPRKTLVLPTKEELEFQKFQKKFQKRYQGLEGIKNFESDVQEKTIEVIEKIRDENEGKSGLKPLVKAADDLLKKDEDGNTVRLKNFEDYKKEYDQRMRNYQNSLKKRKSPNEKEVSSPVPFNYQLAKQEEQKREQKGFGLLKNQNLSLYSNAKENLMGHSRTVLGWGIGFLLLILTWIGWEKWH